MPSVKCAGAIPPWKFVLLAAVAALLVFVISSHCSGQSSRDTRSNIVCGSSHSILCGSSHSILCGSSHSILSLSKDAAASQDTLRQAKDNPTGEAGRAGNGALRDIPISLAEIADRVSHAAQPTCRGYTVTDRDYRARFNAAGVDFTPRKSGRDLSHLVIQLAEVRCGPRIICPGDGKAKPCAAGNEVVYERGHGVVEKYRASGAGIEQSWILKDRPSVCGEIRVSCRARSEGETRTADGGLRFGGGRNAQIGYSIATISDSAGRKLVVSPTYEQGRIYISVPASFVRTTTYPLTIDPLISPEFGISHAYGPAYDKQEAVAVASNGSEFLVVWQDSRSGVSVDIYGTRVNAAGQILDPMGIAISVADNDQTAPRVEWNGSNYLVVWTDTRAWNQVADIYGCRVSASGQALDPSGIRICGAIEVQYAPDVASNGSDWFVVWQDNRSGAIDIYGTRVTSAGTVVSPLGVAIVTGAPNADGCAAAWLGGNYLVAWGQYSESTGYDLYGQMVTSAGSKTGSAFVICAANGNQAYPAIAPRGTEGLVVWQDQRAGYYADIYGSRVNSSGQVLNPGGVRLTEEDGSEELADAAWNGSNYVLVWRDKTTKLLSGRLVASNCAPNSGSFSILYTTAGSRGPSVAAAGGICLVGYNTLSVSADVCGARISSAGALLDSARVLLSQNAFDQAYYSVAFDGTNYMVAWSDDRSGNADVYVARVKQDGSILDASGIRVTSDASDQYDPAIAWSGGNYLVVWTDTRRVTTSGTDIYGARIKPDGQVLDTSGLPICQVSENQSNPAITWNGSKFLVVYEDMRNAVSPDYYNDIYGSLVSSSGTVTLIGNPIAGGARNQYSPAVASDGSNCLVVWQDTKGTFPMICASRVSANGTILDTAGIQVSPVSSTQSSPAVAFDGTNYMIVWSDLRGGVPDLYGVRFSTSAIRTGNEIAISVATRDQLAPTVIWNGAKYLVVWQDYRNDSANSDIYAATITNAGVVIEPNGIQITTSAAVEKRPALACASSSKSLVVYSRGENSTNRLFAVTCNEIPPLSLPSSRGAKFVPSGTRVSIANKVATCSTSAMGNFFYIEEDDGTSGIKVVTSVVVSEGNRVNVIGDVSVVNGEVQIAASQVDVSSSGSPLPPIWSMNMQHVGGGACGLQSCVCDYRVPPMGKTRVLTANFGLNNIGVLVKVYGTVTYTAGDHFYLCDGVKYDDGSGMDGIKVYTGSLTEPAVGSKVLLTAISSCYVRGGNVVRMLRPRRQSDIVLLSQ